MSTPGNGEMTDRAQLAFEMYRDMGPKRSLRQVTQLLGLARGSHSMLRRWSAKYGWQRLIEEHDYKQLREGLGKRELAREACLQRFIERMNDACDVLYQIMMDKRNIPILDRQGNHVTDQGGHKLYKPMVRASTRAMAAEKILGIAGLVPVKRMEMIDKTGEALDEAAQAIATMGPDELQEFRDILLKRAAAEGDEDDDTAD